MKKKRQVLAKFPSGKISNAKIQALCDFNGKIFVVLKDEENNEIFAKKAEWIGKNYKISDKKYEINTEGLDVKKLLSPDYAKEKIPVIFGDNNKLILEYITE